MQKALCNATAEQDKAEHTHICNMEHGHKGKAHFCRCGAIFVSVKKSELEKPLEKVQ